ncbi:hypothetical protein [uncultured Kordia sp.]|uniref:hypothetical protein n=1 Tax=uncultured Kordia sp. TaxID=507699 RepID=UPI00261FAD58|nr:hypothetical protein [uncultured Kordia sp.]
MKTKTKSLKLNKAVISELGAKKAGEVKGGNSSPGNTACNTIGNCITKQVRCFTEFVC